MTVTTTDWTVSSKPHLRKQAQTPKVAVFEDMRLGGSWC